MNVLLLSRYGRLGASSRVRSYQYLPHLEARGITVTVSAFAGDAYLADLYAGKPRRKAAIAADYLRRIRMLLASRRFDLLWIEYELLPWLPAWAESLLARLGVPYVVDYDDAIFHRYDQHKRALVRTLLGGKIAAVMRSAALVIAGNAYLAAYAREAGAPRVEIVPTVVDLERYPPREEPLEKRLPGDRPFTIGWIGRRSQPGICPCFAPRCRRCCSQEAGSDGRSRARVTLVGANDAASLAGAGVPVEVRPWCEQTESAEIRQFDVGIMPLPDAPWERGKCAYKLIQYMACGLPVVASPVGVNCEIIGRRCRQRQRKDRLSCPNARGMGASADGAARRSGAAAGDGAGGAQGGGNALQRPENRAATGGAAFAAGKGEGPCAGLPGFLIERPRRRPCAGTSNGGRLTQMADALWHRGPDDGGAWTDAAAGIGLGHRRLAIVDLSPLGRQPMSARSGRYVLVFNGEIYNFRELRAELERAGHGFRGASDTEVMLAAFEQWGLEPAVKRFNGMFAFALWDRDERALSLGRDRLGEKPLYYGWAGDTFLFASELKALRAHPSFRAELDGNALALMLRHSYIPCPYTIYRGVWKLPPGTLLTVRSAGAAAAAGRQPAPIPFWSARALAETGAAEPFRGTDAEAVAQLDALLRDAVGLRMAADVPLGAFLSGGVDSSAVVALMQAQSARPIKTFSIGFREAGYDEAGHAATVARHLGTDHTELYLSPAEAMAVVPKLPALYDEPFADASQIPTFLVSELARRQVTVSPFRRRRRRAVRRLQPVCLGAAPLEADRLDAARGAGRGRHRPGRGAGRGLGRAVPGHGTSGAHGRQAGQAGRRDRGGEPRSDVQHAGVALEKPGGPGPVPRQRPHGRAADRLHAPGAMGGSRRLHAADDVSGRRDLSARRCSGEGGSGEHGGQPGGARAAARPSRRRVGVAAAPGPQDPERSGQVAAPTGARPLRPQNADRAPQDGLRGADRRLAARAAPALGRIASGGEAPAR
jgi:asparagine synthase (glutamine-hydrolysing)